MKIWPWKSKISGSVTVYLYMPQSSQQQEWSPKTNQILENIGLTKNILGVGKKAVLIQMCHTVCKFLGHVPLSWGTG